MNSLGWAYESINFTLKVEAVGSISIEVSSGRVVCSIVDSNSVLAEAVCELTRSKKKMFSNTRR